MDRYSAEGPQVCHRCTARLGSFLDVANDTIKTTISRRARITRAASGTDMRDHVERPASGSDQVVDWGEDGSTHSPGPNSVHYETMRQVAGAHLVFNAFWLINHFCVHQMLMRDAMHAIDLGVIITLIRAILRAFLECVELQLDIVGRAAAKLESRFRNILAICSGPDDQR